jgi:hypothetical protein
LLLLLLLLLLLNSLHQRHRCRSLRHHHCRQVLLMQVVSG